MLGSEMDLIRIRCITEGTVLLVFTGRVFSVSVSTEEGRVHSCKEKEQRHFMLCGMLVLLVICHDKGYWTLLDEGHCWLAFFRLEP